jgi:hypothetical protein
LAYSAIQFVFRRNTLARLRPVAIPIGMDLGRMIAAKSGAGVTSFLYSAEHRIGRALARAGGSFTALICPSGVLADFLSSPF